MTKATLSELDMHRILQNVKLRHDINFDPDLCFRPNLDGEKGRRKLLRAADFWETMTRQLSAFSADARAWEHDADGAEWCLPATLRAIKEILETLVPLRDRAVVLDMFNIDFLMQQFRAGVADLPGLITWLARLLKCHCAPMRDADIDDMVAIFFQPDTTESPLIRGLAKLMLVLEHMKLVGCVVETRFPGLTVQDIANHQIRCLRPFLIEDTVAFEQSVAVRRIASGRMDPRAAHDWFMTATQPYAASAAPASRKLASFAAVLVHLLAPSSPNTQLPETFQHDEDRLVRLRHEVLDLVNLRVCLLFFRNLDRQTRTGAGIQGRYLGCLEGMSSDEDLSLSPASTPPRSPRMRAYVAEPSLDTLSRLRTSLQAILATTPGLGSERWVAATPALALQIVRSTSSDCLAKLPQLDARLAFHLSNVDSDIYQQAEEAILEQLLTLSTRRIDEYAALPMLNVFESATTPRVAARREHDDTPDLTERHEVAETATRLAHLGTLHWRIWAPLVYQVDPSAMPESMEVDVF